MANVTPDKMRAFGVPRKQNADSIWQDETTATQQSARAGVPTAQQSTGLVLQTRGTMGDGEHIEILTQRGGHASAAGNARFVWRASTSGDYFGRDTANVIDHWQYVNGTVTFDYLPRDCMGTSDGYAYVLCQRAQAGTNSVVVIKRERDGSYNAPVVLNLNTTTLREVFGCLTQLSDGSLLAAYTTYDSVANICNVNVHRSTDDGATWSRVATNALKQNIATSASTSDYTIKKMVMAYNKGQILLLIEANVNLTTSPGRNKIFQYVSVDDGGSFESVAIVGDTYSGYFATPSLVVHQGVYVVSIMFDTTVSFAYRLNNAFVPLDITVNNPLLRNTIYDIFVSGAGEIGTITSNALVGYASMWIDDDDTIWHLYQQQESGVGLELQNFIMVSTDGGVTWSRMGQDTAASGAFNDDAVFWLTDTSNISLNRCIGCSVGGTQLIFHNQINTFSSTYNDYLGVMHLGGYSTVTMPPLNELAGDVARCGWEDNYLPFIRPQFCGYVATGPGTDSVNGQYLTVTTTANLREFSQNITNNLGAGGIIRARFDVTNRSTNTGTLEIRVSDGVGVSYHVRLFVDTSAIRLYDVEAAAYLHASISVAANPELDILIGLGDGDVNAYYRVNDDSTRHTWTEIYSGAVTSGTATQAFVKFGHIGTSTAETHFYEVHWSDDQRTGLNLAYGQTNPQEIWARPYPPQNTFTQIKGGLSITTTDGPTYEGDEWQIDTAYDYPLQNVFYQVAPSTRTGWRSQSVLGGLVTAQRIAWYVDDTAQDMTVLGNDAVCITLQDINFGDFEIQRHNGSTWSTIATYDNKVYNGNFVRDGASVRALAISGYPYLFFNECAQWYARMTNGATTKVRKVRTNSEGVFGLIGSGTKYAVLQLEGIDGTEPTSGTLELIPNRCTVVVNLKGTGNNREAKAFALNIEQQYTNEEYFKIGTLGFGELLVPGRQYSRGRTISFEAGVQENQRNDGTLYTRDTGNTGRRVRVAWVEGVDISDLYESDADPDFWIGTTSSGGEAIAALNDVPDLMIGLARYLNGSQNPLVYLPYLDKSTGAQDNQIFNRYSNHMLCTLDGDVQIENVLGDEWNNRTTSTQGELMRIATINLREVR